MPEYYWAMDARVLTDLWADFKLRLDSHHLAGPVEQGERKGMPIRKMGSTAIIPISGPIMKDVPPIIRALCDMYSTEDYQQALQAALDDRGIKDVMLLIDSPGGSVDGTVELADAVFEVNQRKPVTAQVDGLAASAAYWIASQAGEITASRSSLIGSIGVFSVLYDTSRLYKNEGIEVIPIQTGKFKTTGLQGTEVTAEQIADEQRVVNAYFQDFKQSIVRGRAGRMTADQVDQVADGRVFKADSEAMPLGLVDRINYKNKTLRELTKRQERKQRAMQARVAMLEV